ncbi:porin [Vreelandella jeotgali]|uniref:porin n=1 Tax=Vreelandella jeotgali TaxID=553386 RepID=UPI000347C8C9|nr:porin [Halomonas jeotgali]
MKKTLLATAIAGAAFASGAQAATIYNEDGTKLDLYGNIQIAYKNQKDAAGDSKDELFDNGSTVGFSGEHLITRDLKGYFKAEFEHEADEAKGAGNGLTDGDQAYTGLKGNFGDLRVGSWDPLIDDWIQDPITNNEYFDASDSNGLIVGLENREGNKVSYTSPSFSGFQFAVGTQFEGDAESYKGEAFGFDKVAKESDSNASFFGGAKYTAGAFSIAAVYDNLDNNDGTYTVTSTPAPTPSTFDYDAGDQYGITAQYTVDTLRLSLKAERFDAGEDAVADVDFYGFGARYGYGMGDIYGAYQYVDQDSTSVASSESSNEVILGATYNLSDAMYTFVEAATYDRDEDAKDGVAVGAVYLF